MPTVGYFETEDETKNYANWLFSELTREQLINSGVNEEEIEENPELDFLNVHLNSSLMKQLGHDLRIISEEFARSSERNRVLERAQQVNIEHINYDEFYQFLNELFCNGITRERIIVLFFFCSDVVVRAYSNPMANLRRLFNWFLNYIVDRVCGWVQNHGGWSVVLGHYMPAVSQTIFYCLGSVALVMLMYKKFLKW